MKPGSKVIQGIGRSPTLRPLRSSSLWMATADTHFDAPPDLALFTLSSAIKSVAP